jgi:hypothetical protein
MRQAPKTEVDDGDEAVCSEPLEREDGTTEVICQEAVGADAIEGGGEYPDPDRPPESPAPGG